ESRPPRCLRFFKGLLLVGIRLGMLGARLLRRPVEAVMQILPPALHPDRSATQPGADPGGDRPAVPHIALWGWAGQRRAQLGDLLSGEQPRPAGVGAWLAQAIDQSVRAVLAVAAGDLPYPVRRVAGHRGHLLGGVALSQQPDHLPAAALGAVVRLPVASFEL